MKKITEYSEQVAIFKWAKLHENKYPMLKYMFATLNGVKLSIFQAKKAKAGGNRKGVPDIILPYDNGKYNGLYLELKIEGGRPTKEQREYIRFLKTNNYYSDVRYGFEEAIDLIKDYIEGNLL